MAPFCVSRRVVIVVTCAGWGRGVLPLLYGAPAEVLHTILRQPVRPAASPQVRPCPMTRVAHAGQAMSGSG
jgi:hypothetical protein